jgi:anti-sigma regulatory factor (Ser/Thr protein kinase)
MVTVTNTGEGPADRTAVLSIERSAGNVRIARAFATRLADLVLPHDRRLEERDVHALALMVSELVTNAVEHGDGPVRVAIGCAGPHLRVEISDDGDGQPVRRYAMPGALSGRGLEVVERLAVQWGWRPLPEGGKQVWFDY